MSSGRMRFCWSGTVSSMERFPPPTAGCCEGWFLCDVPGGRVVDELLTFRFCAVSVLIDCSGATDVVGPLDVNT